MITKKDTGMSNNKEESKMSQRQFCRLIQIVTIIGLIAVFTMVSFAEKTKVTFWTMGPLYKRILEQIIPEFEKEFPNIELEMVYGTNAQKLAVALAGGAAPDVVTLPTRQAPWFIGSEAVLPIDFSAFGVQDAQEFATGYWPGILNAISYKGQVYFAPVEINTVATFYNTNMLASHGIGTVPETWEDYISIGRKLTLLAEDGSYSQLGLGFMGDPEWSALYLVSFARQAGSDWITPAGKPNFSDPKVIDALGVYDDIFRQQASIGVWHLNAFTQGQVAFFFDGSYRYFFLKNNAPGLDFATAPYPVLEDGIPATSSWAQGLYVTSQSEHPDLAWQVAAFFTNPRFGSIWLNEGGILQPVREQWLADSLDREPRLLPFVTGLDHAYMEIAHPEYTDVVEHVHAANRAIINGEKPVAAAMIQLDEALAPILAPKE